MPTPPPSHLSQVVQISAGWISSADNKAIGIMSLAGVALGLVLMTSATIPVHPVALTLHLLFSLSAIGTVLCSTMVLWPRTNRSALLGQANPPPLDRSPTYFGDLAKLQYDEFRSYTANTAQADLEADAFEQAYVLSKIAHAKMVWNKRSIFALAATLTLLALLATASYNLSEVSAGVGLPPPTSSASPASH